MLKQNLNFGGNITAPYLFKALILVFSLGKMIQK